MFTVGLIGGGDSNPQSLQSNPQSVESNPQSEESKPQSVESNPQSEESKPQSEELKPEIIQCDINKLINLFPITPIEGDFRNIRKKYSCVPPGADLSEYLKLRLRDIMDPTSKK